MTFTVVSKITKDGGWKILCKLPKREFLEVGQLVEIEDGCTPQVCRVCVPDFDADVAAVLNVWGVSIDKVPMVTAVMVRQPLEAEDDIMDYTPPEVE